MGVAKKIPAAQGEGQEKNMIEYNDGRKEYCRYKPRAEAEQLNRGDKRFFKGLDGEFCYLGPDYRSGKYECYKRDDGTYVEIPLTMGLKIRDWWECNQSSFFVIFLTFIVTFEAVLAFWGSSRPYAILAVANAFALALWVTKKPRHCLLKIVITAILTIVILAIIAHLPF